MNQGKTIGIGIAQVARPVSGGLQHQEPGDSNQRAVQSERSANTDQRYRSLPVTSRSFWISFKFWPDLEVTVRKAVPQAAKAM